MVSNFDMVFLPCSVLGFLTITGIYLLINRKVTKTSCTYYLTWVRLGAGDDSVRKNRCTEGRLLKMGPRVKERVTLLSVSLKFTLLFTLPDAPLLQEPSEPHCGAK